MMQGGAGADPESSPNGDPGALLRNRNFLHFATSRGSTAVAFQILAVSVGWHVYERTGEVLYLGLIGLFMFLPFFALFLLAGLAADRFDRRRIIGLSGLVHAVSASLMGLWLISGQAAIWPVFLLLSVSGSAQAFLHPALQAILPNLVPRRIFSHAVAATSAITKAAQLGGPAIGGLLIALIDTRVYFVAAGCYLMAGVAALLIHADLRMTGKEPFGLTAVLGGFRHIWNTETVLAAVSIDLVAVLFGGVMGLLPVVATEFLGVGPEGLGIMRSAPALGALLVGAALARFGLPWRVGPAFFVSLVIFGLSILVLSASSVFWLSVAALVIYGGSDMVSVYVRITLVQLDTPDHLRGRVSAVNAVSINASNQLGDFRGGMMAALVGTPAAVALGGLMTLACAGIWYRQFPQLRLLDSL